MDASGTRCFAGFLVEVGGALPELVLPVISVLVPHLTGESYTFRNGVLGVMGHLLLHLSRGQGSLTNNPRDQLLSKLMEHVYDTNAFVRVKVIQILDNLVSSKVSYSVHTHTHPHTHTHCPYTLSTHTPTHCTGYPPPLTARSVRVGVW